uniref:MFS domain-containing protein n=1 Tax=Macrostomum lignano TaxID=282301 RepID=A0A1I8G9Q6_9PLAT
HTRGSFSTAMQIELWDSCPEFGRLPPSNWHNQVSRPPPRSKVSMLSKLKRSVLDSKSFKDTKFLFTSWNYLSFLASNFLLYFWYDITYTFMPDHAKEIGLSDNEVSLIIALIGVSNTIGQIVIGYIGDFPRVNTVLLYALCMSLTGVANFLVPWCHSLASLLVYGILYGFLVSANYALCSIVIIDLFGIDRLTTGYGLMMFFQGFANLVGPPAMGHMRDSDSNYDRAFIYSGIFVLVSNLLILSIYPAIYRWARDCCCHGNKAAAGNSATSRKKTPPSLEEAAEEAAEPLTSA